MSKNTERYKNHLEGLDEDTLLELETENFEKFSPKKRKDKKQPQTKKPTEEQE